jgi:excisionase family DNA binding protein
MIARKNQLKPCKVNYYGGGPQMEQVEKPVTVDEAVAFTGLSRHYLYKLIHQKKIPHYKPNGGKVFFKKKELEEFIFRNRQAAIYEAAVNA